MSVSKVIAASLPPNTLASFSLGNQCWSVNIIRRNEPGYLRAARYVQEQFLQAYGARPAISAPAFLLMQDQHGNTHAAVGLRGAASEPLFLEQYLDHSIDHAISQAGHSRPGRRHIIEIAHLACSKRGMSRFMFVTLTALLVQWQYDWIAFTGTRAIRHVFASLNMRPVTLAAANPERLTDSGQSWGRYYDQEPMVMAGEVAGGHQTLIDTRTYEMINLQLAGGYQHAVA